VGQGTGDRFLGDDVFARDYEGAEDDAWSRDELQAGDAADLSLGQIPDSYRRFGRKEVTGIVFRSRLKEVGIARPFSFIG